MGANVAIPERKNLDTIPKLVKHWSESLPDQELFVFYNGDQGESYTCRSRGYFLQELQDSTEPIFVEQDILPDDILIVVTTSGTTGCCKLVAKTHRDLINQWLDACNYVTEHSRQQWTTNVVYNDRLIGWIAGFPFGTYVNADTRVLLDAFETQGSKVGADFWKIICAEKVDYAIMLPLDLDYMLKQTSYVGGADYKMKMICGGGQPIRQDQFISYYAVAREVSMVYASTGTGFLSYGILEEKSVKDYFCGQVAPGVELRVVDADNKECQMGQVGTIHVKGKAVFNGYLNRVENPDPKTLLAFSKDGWLNTDDSGYFDEDSNLYVLGRLKDVIIFGAAFVYPGWLEPKIAQHPVISEACIVPVSDPVLYHNICAIVRPAAGSDISVQELETICRGIFLMDKDIEGTPVPEFYLILKDFPQTATGKVDRKVLQKMAEDNFGVH